MIVINGPTKEQIEYANKLVEYSIKHHPVRDIYENNKPDSYGFSGEERQRQYRFRGTLGETMIADLFGIPRPTRAYGAIDGQDNGLDFIIENKNIDVKTMLRHSYRHEDHYVFNILVRQVEKKESKTDLYLGLSLVEKDGEIKEAWIHGTISPKDVEEKADFFKAGTYSLNDSGKKIYHDMDTYEVKFKDFKTPHKKEERIFLLDD